MGCLQPVKFGGETSKSAWIKSKSVVCNRVSSEFPSQQRCHETPKVNVWRQWANAFYPRSKTQQGRFAVQFSLCHMPYHQDKESRKRQKKNQCLRLNNQDGRYSAASGCSKVGDVFFCFSMQYFSIWIICPGHLAVSLYITHITSYKTHIYVYIKYIYIILINYLSLST